MRGLICRDRLHVKTETAHTQSGIAVKGKRPGGGGGQRVLAPCSGAEPETCGRRWLAVFGGRWGLSLQESCVVIQFQHFRSSANRRQNPLAPPPNDESRALRQRIWEGSYGHLAALGVVQGLFASVEMYRRQRLGSPARQANYCAAGRVDPAQSQHLKKEGKSSWRQSVRGRLMLLHARKGEQAVAKRTVRTVAAHSLAWLATRRFTDHRRGLSHVWVFTHDTLAHSNEQGQVSAVAFPTQTRC